MSKHHSLLALFQKLLSGVQKNTVPKKVQPPYMMTIPMIVQIAMRILLATKMRKYCRRNDSFVKNNDR